MNTPSSESIFLFCCFFLYFCYSLYYFYRLQGKIKSQDKMLAEHQKGIELHDQNIIRLAKRSGKAEDVEEVGMPTAIIESSLNIGEQTMRSLRFVCSAESSEKSEKGIKNLMALEEQYIRRNFSEVKK